MPKIELSNGEALEIDFDLTKLTMREYRDLKNPAYAQVDEDTLLAKVTGIPVEKFAEYTVMDYARITQALIDRVRSPLADPT